MKGELNFSIFVEISSSLWIFLFKSFNYVFYFLSCSWFPAHV